MKQVGDGARKFNGDMGVKEAGEGKEKSTE
jgi:hypothetical protein